MSSIPIDATHLIILEHWLLHISMHTVFKTLQLLLNQSQSDEHILTILDSFVFIPIAVNISNICRVRLGKIPDRRASLSRRKVLWRRPWEIMRIGQSLQSLVLCPWTAFVHNPWSASQIGDRQMRKTAASVPPRSSPPPSGNRCVLNISNCVGERLNWVCAFSKIVAWTRIL